MGRVLGIALGIGLLFSLIVLAALKLPIGVSLNAAPLETAQTPRAILVSVPKLWTDYRESEVAAGDRYKGKRLVVEGQVAGVNKGSADDAYVLLSTFDTLEPIHADMKTEYQTEAVTLRTGQIITVDCEGAGMTTGVLFLMACSIQPNSSVVQSSPQSPSGAQWEPHVTLPTLIYTAPAAYSAEARQNKLEGTVQIRLVVDEKGNPQNVTVVRSLGMGLDESAVEAVKHYKFRPAVDESTGRVVTAVMTLSLQFHLS